MDMYVWVARRKGFDVSDIGYFVYVDAQHKGRTGMLSQEHSDRANMEFAATIIPYKADPSWVEPTLVEIKDFLLNQKDCPEHTKPNKDNPYSGCDNGRYFEQVMLPRYLTAQKIWWTETTSVLQKCLVLSLIPSLKKRFFS